MQKISRIVRGRSMLDFPQFGIKCLLPQRFARVHDAVCPKCRAPRQSRFDCALRRAIVATLAAVGGVIYALTKCPHSPIAA
jgi:hypothetical protein